MGQKNVILSFAIVGFLSIIVEVIFPIHYHPYYWWHAFIGFDYIFGLLGGFLLIFISKGILFPIVKRKKDIYERSEEE
ncbi:MAG: hypothetical protein PHH19_00825 [Eubacteriales bacterium]|nr:hypothetical protein [Eubacteriales bacterium]NCC81633.1 hypothetical protein [Clostridia bacterium]